MPAHGQPSGSVASRHGPEFFKGKGEGVMYRVRRFGVVRTATTIAVMFALVALIIVVPFVLLFAALAPAIPGRGGAQLVGSVVGALLFVPLVYGLLAWISTAVSCLVYNLVAGWVGGVEFQLEVAPPPAVPVSWGPGGPAAPGWAPPGSRGPGWGAPGAGTPGYPASWGPQAGSGGWGQQPPPGSGSPGSPDAWPPGTHAGWGGPGSIGAGGASGAWPSAGGSGTGGSPGTSQGGGHGRD